MRWAACRTAAFRRLATGGYLPYLGHACPFPLRPLHKRRWDRLSGRDGRKAADWVWPKAAGPLRRRPDEKADGPVATQFHCIASGDNALDRASAIASVAVEAVAVADMAVQRIQALDTLVDRRGSRGDPSNATDHSPRQGGSNPPPDPCGACPVMSDRGFHSAPRVTPRTNRVDRPELASRRPARPGRSE